MVLWDIGLQERQECVGIGRPGGAWPASTVVVEGVETGSVASYWASSDARSTGRAGAENSFTEPTWSLAV